MTSTDLVPSAAEEPTVVGGDRAPPADGVTASWLALARLQDEAIPATHATVVGERAPAASHGEDHGIPSPSQPRAAQASKPINDTLWNRFRTLFLYRSLLWWRERRGRPVGAVLMTSKLCIKTSTLAEAHAMRFVAQHTSIPVPKVYTAFEHAGEAYILMDRVPGQMLAVGYEERSEESKQRILDQLRDFVAQLRAIRPPPRMGRGVSSVDGGPIYGQLFPGPTPFLGPFRTISDFHKALRGEDMTIESVQDVVHKAPSLPAMIVWQDRPWPTSVFTHGDLSSFNIMVNTDDQITGIIDWETAGWYPPYWEYTAAYDATWQNRFWQKEVGRFMTIDPYDLKMDMTRKRYCTPFSIVWEVDEYNVV